MPDLLGRSLGRYHILEQLGEGGMATVYKAFDTRLECDVAVKVIRTENLPQSSLERALKRFEREAKALARLTHSNIVKVTDYGEFEGKPYLVMPYLPGGTLKAQLGKAIPWQEAVRLLLPIARALDYAHQQGMIHRDVKPSNILITHSGDPMLTDFGIAKIIDEELTVDLTGTSATVGTPEYMAPEQVISKTVDGRADMYALGVVFYEMVTGRKPFTADTPMAVLFKHASEPLPRPLNFVPSLPDNVEKLLLKSLAKKPQDRYADMAGMAHAMEGLLTSAHSQPITGKMETQEIAQLTPNADTQQTVEQVKEHQEVNLLPPQVLKPSPQIPPIDQKGTWWLARWVLGEWGFAQLILAGGLVGGIIGGIRTGNLGSTESLISIMLGGFLAGIFGGTIIILRLRKKATQSAIVQVAGQDGASTKKSSPGPGLRKNIPSWWNILWVALISELLWLLITSITR